MWVAAHSLGCLVEKDWGEGLGRRTWGEGLQSCYCHACTCSRPYPNLQLTHSPRPPHFLPVPLLCRAAGEMLLDEMFEAFDSDAAAPLAAAVTARLQASEGPVC